MMFLSGADVNYQPILLLHASSHDSINLGADRSDGVHGRVLCKCEEREVYSREKKNKKRFIYVSYISTSISIIPPPPLPLRRDPQLCFGAVWSLCD